MVLFYYHGIQCITTGGHRGVLFRYDMDDTSDIRNCIRSFFPNDSHSRASTSNSGCHCSRLLEQLGGIPWAGVVSSYSKLSVTVCPFEALCVQTKVLTMYQQRQLHSTFC